MSEQAKHKIAAFDFDGTSIKGNSPVILVRFLRSQGMLRKRVISKVLAWAAAYKLRLPQSEAWVRGLVFTAFEGQPRESVDAFLSDFYEKEIDRAVFGQADEAMIRLREEGVEVLIVSATFGRLSVAPWISTRLMAVCAPRCALTPKGGTPRASKGRA